MAIQGPEKIPTARREKEEERKRRNRGKIKNRSFQNLEERKDLNKKLKVGN